ncbi:DUF3010 family protein [Shewanella schlegeliana]|uniref:DUF3010 family protein n=1 Tax=Shewanella schlegeliana TaxID=190308 RepID=A0ABS1SVX1_9GAMM|nr:DUF3010 family protein [Shewanella schlegeliana]MBL4912686.1 DUF3010 family protein [Shewanella schlegeliana]MCL1109804.1 DUF3010 family protein [Shewanella schlegeliana]GIU30225.1 hypothetical protein TUM4433_20440 [Shewanella schlegeliana]
MAEQVVCGCFLKANEVRLATLAGCRSEHRVIAPKTNKFSLVKNPSQAETREFVAQIKTYLVDHNVSKLVLNRRATTGQGAGGAGTFLMEGAILASVEQEVEFIHPATLRATDKRCSELKQVKPKTVDLGKAYDLAFECLSE